MFSLKHALTNLCLFVSLAVSSGAHAVVTFSWDFTNSNQTWQTDETIYLHARLTNTGDENLVLGDTGQGIFGGSSGWNANYAPVSLSAGPGEYDFDLLFYDPLVTPGQAPLGPGASIDFIFGSLTPFDTVAPGFYYGITGELWLPSPGAPIIFTPQSDFAFTVVPIPAALPLLLSGALLLGWTARRRSQA